MLCTPQVLFLFQEKELLSQVSERRACFEISARARAACTAER
jgi:hypothetical protein